MANNFQIYELIKMVLAEILVTGEEIEETRRTLKSNEKCMVIEILLVL